MNSRYKIVFSDRAKADLKKIIDGILDVSLSARSARKWYELIVETAEMLALFPEGNPQFRDEQNIRSANVGKYKLVYEVLKKDKIVNILRILYARRALNLVKLR